MDEASLVDAFAASLQQDEGLSPGVARCLGQAAAAQVDLRELGASGLAPEELARLRDLPTINAVHPDAESAMASTITGCGLGDETLGIFADAFGTSPATIECMRTAIDERELAELYASLVFGSIDRGSAAGAEYGGILIDRLPDDCAKTVAIGLLLESAAITEPAATCLQARMTGEEARLMIGPEGGSSEARLAVARLIEDCPD